MIEINPPPKSHLKIVAMSSAGLRFWLDHLQGILAKRRLCGALCAAVILPLEMSKWVKKRTWRQLRPIFALPPCVDGSELARRILAHAALVGAAMCSRCRCCSHDRWP